MLAACPQCSADVALGAGPCRRCGHAVPEIEGFPSFAPEQATLSDSYDADSFGVLAAMEADSFWFTSRNRLINWAARRYFPRATSIHEVGCGTGFVLAGLRRAYPSASISGSELFVAGLRHAAHRVPDDVALVQLDARQMPFRSAFDLVGAFDVIEHVDEDAEVLASIRTSLRPGGGLLLTVPQHAWLWSVQDEAAHHRRRYDVRDLHRKVRAAGFQIVRSTSFVSLVLPAMLAARRLPGRFQQAEVEALRVHPLIDRAFRPILAVERGLIARGLSIPIGGSRLVVAVAIGSNRD